MFYNVSNLDLINFIPNFDTFHNKKNRTGINFDRF